MNKVIIKFRKNQIIFSKYEKEILEEELNNTNIIDTKNLKFTEEYINENLDLVSTFLNLLVLKTLANECIINDMEIAEVSLKLIENINNIKKVIFKQEIYLNYTIANLLIKLNNIEQIDCYDIPIIMFQKFKNKVVNTRVEVHSKSKFFEINKIKTPSDIYNLEILIVPEKLEKEDIDDMFYFLENNHSIKKIIFLRYSLINLETILKALRKINNKKINIIILEDSNTTKELLNNIKIINKIEKKYNAKIKIKYSKKYIEENKISQIYFILSKYILRIIIILLLIFALLFSLRLFISSNETKKVISDIDELVEAKEETKEEKENLIQENLYDKNYNNVYEELIKINSDTIGWLTVPNTKINYPIVQYKNNEYYLNHSFDKSYNNYGWVFADYRNNFDLIDKNTIIYGHSMISEGYMFSTLENILNSSWYDNNTSIEFSIKGKKYTWQIFSVYTIDVTSDYLKIEFDSNNEYSDFINMLISRSIKNFEVDVTTNDKILTLSACYKDDKHRAVLHAKLL